ncbi:MAG TPA: hypothetical protein VGC99_28820 [Candidatus Tectomicrobia bacterium]
MKALIPQSLTRRLILSLIGFRTYDGAWWRGPERLTEEQVDAMSAAQWNRYGRRWLSSAAATN